LVSTSRDNLPAVEEPQKPPTLPGVLMALANLVFKRDAVLWLAAIVVLLAAGAAGVVYAQDAGVKLLIPVEEHLTRTDARVLALEKNQADMQRMTVETNATLKLVAMRLGVTPITLEQPKDGGP
jgi:urease accessory protein UreF